MFVDSHFLLWEWFIRLPDHHVFIGPHYRCSVEGDSEVGDLVGPLRDANAVLVLGAEFDEELFAILAWVGEYDVEVVEREFLAFEGDLGGGLVVDLSLHGFDQVEAGLVGFDLNGRRRTLKLTTLSTRLVMVISECISCSSRN